MFLVEDRNLSVSNHHSGGPKNVRRQTDSRVSLEILMAVTGVRSKRCH